MEYTRKQVCGAAMLLCSLVFIGLFAMLFTGFGAKMAQGASYCHTRDSASRAPTGYGEPYSLKGMAKTLLLKANCSDTGATFEVGTGSTEQYIYQYGYEYVGNAWKRISLTGAKKEGSWLVGSGTAALTRTPAQLAGDNFVVAYVCEWDGRWKCGCRDAACTTPHWQLQSFKRAQAAQGGGIHAQLGQKFAMKIGETKTLSDLQVTLVDVTDDNRCPSGVECIVAGSVKASIKTTLAGAVKTHAIEQNAGQITVGKYTIRMVDASPATQVNKTIDKNSYTLYFTVSEATIEQSRTDASIVYGTDQNRDMKALAAHCTAEGGVFSTCGSLCPEGVSCPAVCSLVCTLKGSPLIEGKVVSVDTSPLAYDGPAKIIIEHSWGTRSTILVSSGFSNCSREAINVDFAALKPGMSLAARGEVTSTNTISVCKEGSVVTPAGQ